MNNLEAHSTMVGKELGTSEWFAIDQDHIHLLADATGNHQWIDIDTK